MFLKLQDYNKLKKNKKFMGIVLFCIIQMVLSYLNRLFNLFKQKKESIIILYKGTQISCFFVEIKTLLKVTSSVYELNVIFTINMLIYIVLPLNLTL